MSSLTGGPCKKTLTNASRPKIPVLDYLDDENLREHLQNYKRILQAKLPPDNSLKDVITIMPSDATATTGRLVDMLVDDTRLKFDLVGAFHV